jgi:hypothetical protein
MASTIEIHVSPAREPSVPKPGVVVEIAFDAEIDAEIVQWGAHGRDRAADGRVSFGRTGWSPAHLAVDDPFLVELPKPHPPDLTVRTLSAEQIRRPEKPAPTR